MKVLFVTNMWPSPARPWYGSFVFSQAGSLRDAGVDVDVLPIEGHAGRAAYARAAARVAGLNRHARHDVVHAHYGHAGAVARLQFRAPLVLSYCGDDLLGTPDGNGGLTPRSRVEAAIFRRVAHVCAATITKSEEMQRRLPPSCRARNHVIPNGVDVDRFAPMPREEARRRLGWPEEGTVALFAGDPKIARKNFPLAEAIVERSRADVPGLRLEVACGLPPELMPVVMSAADVLLLTSLSEGSPNVVKEAMAAALPVVATRVGDVVERLDGIAGCRACDADPDEMSAALKAAVAGGRSEQARRAVQAISTRAVAARVISVYESVSRGGLRSSPSRTNA